MPDNSARQINQAGLELIKSHEGLALKPYLCPAGKPTIGYGHVILPGESFGQGLTPEQAEALLQADLATAQLDVAELASLALGGNQFSALVSFVFNLGRGNLASSTLLKKLNAGDLAGAAAEFPKWCKVSKKNAQGQVYKEELPGLKKRRLAEQALFLLPEQEGGPGAEA